MERGQIIRIFLIAGAICFASCVAIQVGAPPEPHQAIESDSEKVRRAIAELRTISTALPARLRELRKPEDTGFTPCAGQWQAVA